jgi:transcriptional regulator with XRE-family HTH domain
MISRYETGVTSPRMDILYRLAEAVDLEIVVALRPASPPEPVERADHDPRAVPLSPTSSDLHTGGQAGDAVFTIRGDIAP